MLAAAPPDAVAAVTGELRGCKPSEGNQKCSGGKLRHQLLLLQRMQRAATCCVQAAAPAAVAATAKFFKLFSFFLCSLRIGMLDVNSSE